MASLFQRIAQARIVEPEVRSMLFEYFVDKLWIGADTPSVTSLFYDSTELMIHDDYIEAHKTGGSAAPLANSATVHGLSEHIQIRPDGTASVVLECGARVRRR